jgi:serine/threonine-protein kinase
VPDVFARLTEALADRYALDRKLGEGGMASVYLAEDLRHRRKVAIKVLRPELAAVIGAERFLKEIETTAGLQHPHILPLLDSGHTGDGPGKPGPYLFYVMPFVDGESLRARLTRDKQLPLTDAVRIATEVASALDYAHRHGVIHRDIKPENILLHEGSALVADFGIALAASKAGGTRMTETGMSLGTPHYMSPEQAMGEREITARSDVYALGVVTYEMLTGDPPFTGSTAQAIVARVLTEPPRPLAIQRRTIPPHVEAAVMGALEKLPADRWGSAAEFGATLEGRGARTVVAGTTLATAAGSRRSGRPTVVALGLVALAAGGLAAWAWLRPPPVPPVSRQAVVLWRHALEPFLAPSVEHSSTQAAIAPDGSSIVFADSIGGGVQLMLKRREDAEATPIAGTEGGLAPFFSPDGKWIGYVTVDGRVRKVPVGGGGSVTLTNNASASYLAAAWLDDGTIVFVGQDKLRRVSAQGGGDTPVGRRQPERRFNVVTLTPIPGSRGVLYTAFPGNCSIESSVNVFDFAADSGRILVPNALGAWYSPTGHVLYTDRAGGLYAVGFDRETLVQTSGAVPVLEGVAPAGFALSPSGSAVYSLQGAGVGPRELTWVSRDGRAEPVDSSWRAAFEYPALSPDGHTLAVSVRDGATQLWIRRADGTRHQVSQQGTVNWRPSWTADGRAIAFVSNMRGAGRGAGGQDDYDVYRVPVDGSAPPALLLHHRFGLWEAELSRDGQWLVVRSDEEGGVGHIRARRLTDDTAMVPLVVGTRSSTQAALSPDGRWLAYSSDASGKAEIYVTPFPSAAAAHLVSHGGGTEPRWSHGGRELFFRSANRLVSVSIAPGATFVAGTPKPLFPLTGYRSAYNRQQYDVAPDDRRFVMIREPDAAGPGTVVYAENWLAELQAKVRAAAK